MLRGYVGIRVSPFPMKEPYAMKKKYEAFLAGLPEEKRKKVEALVQFVKFGMVGGFNTVLSYVIVNVMFYVWGINEQIGNIVAFVITVFISYMANSRFVFSETAKDQSFLAGLVKVYISYSITGLFITSALLYAETHILDIPLYIGTFANIFITVPINFILNKFWAYRKKS
ncbi:MAG: GtrA family protein [Lachnospiraceae bacterium]|nr:GtrA family protein [Lachnospiraceae bacterium]